MFKKFLKKHRKSAILLLILNFLFISSAFGAISLSDTTAKEDPVIFPFEKSTDSQSTVNQAKKDSSKYNEDLYEVKNDGVYDAKGNLIKSANTNNKKSSDKESSSFQEYSASITGSMSNDSVIIKNQLNGIKVSLKKEIGTFNSMEAKVSRVESNMEPIRKKADNLRGQIDILNGQIAGSRNKIINIELQVAEKQISLKKLMKDLEVKEVLFNAQKKIASEYIVLVYSEEEKFLDYYDSSSSTLKLLLAENTVSENLLGIEYSKVLEETGRKVFYDLYNKKVELEERKKKIEEEKSKLDGLNKKLNQEKRVLGEGKTAKKDLLAKTLGQEERYKKLLEQSIQQQLESAIAIQNMKENIDLIEEKIKSIGDQSSIDELNKFKADIKSIDNKLKNNFLLDLNGKVTSDGKSFIWPVAPRAITAYFHDPTYPKRWGIHQAIDIRASQFTQIRAPANAYVFQTKDNGMGYSYIILAHKNNIITVYGHVTQIMVKTGAVVKQGDVIGLSGGAPGTKGAGWQTTGPHLHFEVWHKGKPIDPLTLMPLSKLPAKYVPEKYK